MWKRSGIISWGAGLSRQLAARLHPSGNQCPLTHPQPQKPQARTSQALHATPQPLPASLHALRPTPRPSRATSRPCSDKVRSVVRDAFSVDREGFSVAGNRLTLASGGEDLRTPRLSALRFGVFRLRAWVDRLRAKVAGLCAKGKPLRAVSGPLQARVVNVAGGGGGRWPSCPHIPRGISELSDRQVRLAATRSGDVDQ
jgi:hypothetical protein